MAKWSLQDAKNHFSEVVTAARKSPQTVTKHGKPAVVVVDVDAYQRLTKTKKLMKNGKELNFIEHLLAMPKGGEDFEFGRRKPKRRDIAF